MGEEAATTEVRAADGRFLPGKSGNPSGRPPSKQQRITDLQRTLEEHVRTKVRPERIVSIIDKMCEMAENGNVKAATALLGYVMTKPTLTEESEDKGKGNIVIRIENATFKPEESKVSTVIEGESREL